MSQRSGRAAEKRFSLLCSEAEVSCNKSDEDDHGWDFVVDIPSTGPRTIAADLEPGVTQILVQIKSTQREAPKARLKVSNALQLANSSLPCFVVLFQKTKTGKENIFVRHFWKDLLEQTFKRARTLSAAMRKVHNAYLQIDFRQCDRQDDHLIAWLVESVKKLQSDYGSTKNRLCRELGYSDGSYSGQVSFGPIQGIEDIVDHQLGLTDSIPVSYIKLTDSRFGIEAPMPLFEGKPTRFRMKLNSGKQCQLVLHSHKGDSLTLPAKLFLPSLPGLSLDQTKMKIETWMMTLVVQRGQSLNVNFRVAMEDDMPLSHLLYVTRFLSWGGEDPIDVKVVGDGLTLLRGRLTLKDHGDEPVFAQFVLATEILTRVQSRAGLEEVELRLLDLFEGRSSLFDFCFLLAATTVHARFSHDLDWFRGKTYSRLLGYVDIQLSDFLFFVVLEFPITQTQSDAGGIDVNMTAPMWRECLGGKNLDRVRSDGRLIYEKMARDSGDNSLLIGDILTSIRVDNG